MVSEAVSSGKKVVVFNLRKAKDRGLTKYEASLRNLESGAYLKITEPLGLAGAIVSASRDASPAKRPPDREAIFEAARRLI
jgi:hypothetical protein